MRDETLGRILEEARKKKNLSFEDIENEIQIREQYVRALEENKLRDLPADIYLRRILKKYCGLLDLDYDHILRIYRKQEALYTKVPKEFVVKKYNERNVSMFLEPKKILTLIASFIIFFVIAYLGWQYYAFARAPKINILFPPEEITVNEGKIEIQGQTDELANLEINGQPINVKEHGFFTADYYLSEGRNDIEIKATNPRSLKERISIKVVFFEE